MKQLAFCALALIVMTAPTAVEKSHDIYVNGHFLISSYKIGGKQFVALDDLSKLLGGRLAINGGKAAMSSPPGEFRGHGLFVRKAGILGNVVSLNGRNWIATSDFLHQIGGAASVSLDRLGAGAPLQIRLFDCPDVRCCPDCGIAVRF